MFRLDCPCQCETPSGARAFVPACIRLANIRPFLSRFLLNPNIWVSLSHFFLAPARSDTFWNCLPVCLYPLEHGLRICACSCRGTCYSQAFGNHFRNVSCANQARRVAGAPVFSPCIRRVRIRPFAFRTQLSANIWKPLLAWPPCR